MGSAKRPESGPGKEHVRISSVMAANPTDMGWAYFRNVARGYSETVNPEIHAGFVDFRLENHREPRRAVGSMGDVTGNPNPGY